MSSISGHAATFLVDTLSDDEADGLTLREALVAANTTIESDTIEFSPNLTGSLTLVSGEVSIDEETQIIGPSNGLTISGNQSSRIFNISTTTVSISNLNFIEGNDTEGGALLVRDSKLTLTNCEISGCESSSSGGGIACESSELSLINCAILNNSSSENGGGISAPDTELSLTNCSIERNTAVSQGGGIFLTSVQSSAEIEPELTMIQCSTSNNSATSDGGGIFIEDLARASLIDSTFSDNGSSGNSDFSGSGAGVASERVSQLYVERCLFSRNISNFFGGSLSVSYGSASLANCAIYGSQSSIGGAAAFYSCANVTLANCTIVGNQAGTSLSGSPTYGDSGGIYSGFTDDLILANCSITGNSSLGNSSNNSGGVSASGVSSDRLEISNSIIAFNAGSSNDTTDLQVDANLEFTFAGPTLLSVLNSSLSGDDTIIESDPSNVFKTTTTVNNVTTGALANNGGNIPTIMLLGTGIATDAGSNSSLIADTLDLDNDGDISELLPVDARGFARISGSSIDLGSYEFNRDLILTLESIAPNGSAVLSFPLNQTLAPGQSWILSRATDLENFSTIFSYDGSNVTFEELGNSSVLETENTFTITDADYPEPKAFYQLEIGMP